MKILLDPNIYTINTSFIGDEVKEQEHYFYMNRVFSFIDKYLTVPFVCSNLFFNEIIKQKEHPWNQYKIYKEHNVAMIYQIIMKKLDWDGYVNIDSEDTAVCKFDFNLPNGIISGESFLKFINFAHNHSIEIAIFMGFCHHTLSRPIEFDCNGEIIQHLPIFDPYIDKHDLLLELAVENGNCNKYPERDEPFPNADICCDFNEEYYKQLTKGMDKKFLCKDIGKEVAIRNNYLYDHNLSKINEIKYGALRDVYKSIGQYEMYLSNDFESGGFEVFDHTKCHLGQYSFDGRKIKEASPQDHILYTKL